MVRYSGKTKFQFLQLARIRDRFKSIEKRFGNKLLNSDLIEHMTSYL